MRLIDADELAPMVKRLIELTPTAAPVTHETAIDFLSEEGWLQEHDRILTESAVKHGRWIERGKDDNRCSLCGWGVWVNTNNYCPNCGAYMKGEQDEQAD